MFHRSLILSSFICCIGLTLGQQNTVRPLPRPLISIACGRSSILKTTRLIPQAPNLPTPSTCTYSIIANNFHVCQLRLDFVRFSLPQPSINPTPLDPVQECNDGYLQVGNIKLCGENTNQHIYVPVNPRLPAERTTAITIIANGQGNYNWDITVNQLECPLGQSRSIGGFEMVNAMRASNATAEMYRPVRTPKMIVSDWLAPPGCLQYFVEPTSSLIFVESFNYNNGVGPYIGNMNYAICFRRMRNNQRVELTKTLFKMAITDPTARGINGDCFEVEGQTPGRSEDYLMIPSAVVNLPDPNNPGTTILVRANRFCGTSLEGATEAVVSAPPGPFQLIFNSDHQYHPDNEVGFRFQYKIV